MAAVMAKPLGTATKMKKPPAPILQTNIHGAKPAGPSASPSSARKTLPGQTQTPTSATSATNGVARPNRRLQRLSTRNNTADNGPQEKRAAKKYPEPYVPKDSHILRKFKGCAPSLIVHLHPTHFRFDQQDGSFSYHSEMRVFIEHLAKGTIPHDMVEEFRKSEVKYYDGWLIVRVVDHKSAAKDAASSGAAADDGKPFSIHNYNQYITPSPYAPYPAKEQFVAKSPPLKQEQNDIPHSDDTVDVAPKSSKLQPRIYHVALRPTILSRHMDLVIDAMTPDPKSLHRKGSLANVNSRVGGAGAPQTPISGIPQTPATEKGPPFKKIKLKIDPKDMIDYEARIVNATAPPLFLDVLETLEEAESLLHMMNDPLHDQRPPSPKSRKRTVAELAADDAHAKEQERFMLVLDERTAGTNGTANAGAVDGQAAAALFQPRFEKFNALDNIKREIAERKQREKERQIQEDENRRSQQERMQEEERKRIMMQRAQEARMLRARQAEVAASMAAQQQQPQPPQPVQRPPSSQVNGIPPNMRNQIMQNGGSPIIRQGTPHAASSPVVTSSAQGAVPMAVSSSQQGHGSPPRPGSAVQHGHPSAPMTRGPSQQGPSRNGTPQIPHGTPAQRNATPIIRQNTPAQSVPHASPHGATPQMMAAGMMQGMPAQMPNGVHRQLNPQQVAEMQRRAAFQQHAAQQAAMQNGMVNGTPQLSAAQVAQIQAQQAQQAQAQANREAAIRQQQAMQSQQGTPQPTHMSPNPNQNQKAYNASVAEAMKAQMQSLQQGQNHGSPAPNHMTPQQQHAQMTQAQAAQQQRMMQAAAQAQAQAQGQMMGGQGPPHPQQQQQQQRIPMDPETQRQFQQTFSAYQQRLAAQTAAKYGGNLQLLQPQEIQQIKVQAQRYATQAIQKQRQMGSQLAVQQQMQQLQARQQMAAQQQQQQQGGGGMPNGMMGMAQNMHGGQGQQGHPNMAAMLQQQQAQQMQQMQMAHAQQMMAAQQQQQQQQQQQNMQFQQR